MKTYDFPPVKSPGRYIKKDEFEGIKTEEDPVVLGIHDRGKWAAV